jgi:hypothetical protein
MQSDNNDPPINLRLRHLERDVFTLRLTVLFVMVLAVWSAFGRSGSSPEAGTPTSLRVRELVLVDEEGRERGSLRVPRSGPTAGCPSFLLFSGGPEANGGSVGLVAQSDGAVICAGGAPDSSGTYGGQNAMLGVSAGGGGFVGAAGGGAAVKMGAFDGHPRLVIVDDQKRQRVALGLDVAGEPAGAGPRLKFTSDSGAEIFVPSPDPRPLAAQP